MREYKINPFRRDHTQTTLLAIVELEKHYRAFDPQTEVSPSNRTLTPFTAHKLREVNGIHTDRSFPLDSVELGTATRKSIDRALVRQTFSTVVEEGITESGQLQDMETIDLTRLRKLDAVSAVFLKKVSQPEDLQSEAEHDVNIIIENSFPSNSRNEAARRGNIMFAQGPYIAYELAGQEEVSDNILTPQLARDVRKRLQPERFSPYTELDELLLQGTDWDTQQMKQVNTIYRAVQRNGMVTLGEVQQAPPDWGVTARKLGPEAVAFVNFTLRYPQTIAGVMGKAA